VVREDEKNEHCSVKSGYNLAMKCIIRSDRHHVAGNWNGIWKTQSTHKARHLLWRLCRGCLPTQCRLTQRYVDCELSCPVCDIEVEDDIHEFFGFASASESWSTVDLSQLLHNATYQHNIVANRVFEMCRNEDSVTVGRVASLFWCIWYNRNNKIWNDSIQSPSQVGRMTFIIWNEWFTVHQLQTAVS
jgi:hypothetical protein